MSRWSAIVAGWVALGLMLGATTAVRAQDKDPAKRVDKPRAEKEVLREDARARRGPRADRAADRPRSERDRGRPPRRRDGDRPGMRHPEAGPPDAHPIEAPPLGPPPGKDFDRGRRFPRGPGGMMGPHRPGFGPGHPMGMKPGMGMPGMPGPGPGMPGWQPQEPADPEMRELDQADQELARRSMELAAAYRRASSEKKEQLRKELRETVDQHFDVRQKRRELQLKRLEQQLQQLREAIQRRMKVRDQIIERRISELTGEEDPLDF